MVLPTLDVYFDVALIYQFANEGNPIFAGALSIPVIIFALFLLPHWWKTERNLCQNQDFSITHTSFMASIKGSKINKNPLERSRKVCL